MGYPTGKVRMGCPTGKVRMGCPTGKVRMGYPTGKVRIGCSLGLGSDGFMSLWVLAREGAEVSRKVFVLSSDFQTKLG